MIDLHAHYLPSIDDGADSIKTSLSMLRESYKQGVRVCVATPHCVVHEEQQIEKFLLSRNESINKLKDICSDLSGQLPALISGAEVYLDNDISRYKAVNSLCIGDTNNLLVEFPQYRISRRTVEWLYSLTLRDIHPVIAHIDRYECYEELLLEFADLSLSYQINAGRFFSFSGRRIVKRLLSYDNNYVVSSDMHNTTTRPCNMGAAFSKAKRIFGSEAQGLFVSNAKALLGEGT